METIAVLSAMDVIRYFSFFKLDLRDRQIPAPKSRSCCLCRMAFASDITHNTYETTFVPRLFRLLTCLTLERIFHLGTTRRSLQLEQTKGVF